MNECGFRTPFFTYILNWAKRVREDGEMTLPFRHWMRNLIPGGPMRARYLSVTDAPHSIESLRVSGEDPQPHAYFNLSAREST